MEAILTRIWCMALSAQGKVSIALEAEEEDNTAPREAQRELMTSLGVSSPFYIPAALTRVAESPISPLSLTPSHDLHQS